MRRVWSGAMVLLAMLWISPANAQSKAADYLKKGKLKARIEVTITQGGFAGETGEWYAVSPNGSWAKGSVWIPKEGKSKPKQTGKLTAKQMMQLARAFAHYDLLHLPSFGKPVVNPKTLSIQFGAKKAAMTEKRPTPEHPLSVQDKAIMSRYQGILQAVQGVCRASGQAKKMPITPAWKQIETRIVKIVAETLNLRTSAINVSIPLSKQKNPTDDLDLVEIIMSIEEAFDIEIKDEEIGAVSNNEFPHPSIVKLVEIVVRKTTK